jgi:hypothetical protein
VKLVTWNINSLKVRMPRVLARLGALGALPVVLAGYAVLTPVTLAFDNPPRRIAGAILLAFVLAHCLARPAGGWRVFFLVGLSCITCTIVDDILALPRWVGLVFGPIALLLAWYEDHPDEDEVEDLS